MSRPCAYVPATTVIDPTAPGGIEAMLAFHRATFGDARMDASAGDSGGDTGATGGESGDDASADSTGDGQSSDSTGSTSSTADTEQQTGKGLPDDPDALKAMIADLRKENAASRTNAKAQAADEARQALVQELGKALGLVKDGEDAPKPEELTAQVQAAQQAAREAAIELAVYRGASKHQGDPDALLDSRTFLEKVAALDPKAEDFTTKIDAAIKDAVDTNPKLKATLAAARSGNDFTGGTGEGRITPERFKAMTPAEKNQLYINDPALYRQLSGS